MTVQLEGQALVRMRIAANAQHAPHDVEDAGKLLAHLVAQHEYTAAMLSGGTRSFLTTLHLRAHQRMAEDSTGTIPELVGSAERLFVTAFETLEALLTLDRDLTRRLATRWIEALSALVR